MKWYIIKRLIAIIPVLLITSLLAFVLSRNVPQDPVESYLLNTGGSYNDDELAIEESIEYKNAVKRLGYDKPPFYFAFVPNNYPKNYYKLNRNQVLNLKSTNLIWPSFRWHGFNNQYHRWLGKVVRLDFGISFVDGRAVSTKIYKALSWTGLMVILSLILIFALGIPLGIYSAKAESKKISKLLDLGLYVLFAVPVFWLATLMLVFFTTDDYGSWTNIFPAVGVMSSSLGIFGRIQILILPVLILCLHSAAYISRQTKSGIKTQFNLPYTKTAYSKGLATDVVLYKHNLKNALLPLITIASDLIPSLFAGSLILEVIFNIPGIGRLLYGSIQLADWNIVFGLMMIIAIITVISFLIGDVLYKIVNPKIELV